MISYNEALNILQEVALQLPSVDQEIPITESMGSVLSRDVFGRERAKTYKSGFPAGLKVALGQKDPEISPREPSVG